jgi:hypothetical protein
MGKNAKKKLEKKEAEKSRKKRRKKYTKMQEVCIELVTLIFFQLALYPLHPSNFMLLFVFSCNLHLQPKRSFSLYTS